MAWTKEERAAYAKVVTKGARGCRCSIDRVDNSQGYHIGNIQILTMRQNLNMYLSKDRHGENETPF